MNPFLRLILRGSALVALTGLPMASVSAQEFDVEGYGLFPEAALRRLVSRLEESGQQSYDYAFIENALFLIDGQVEKDGYLNAFYTITTGDPDVPEAQREFTWDGKELLTLPTDLDSPWVRILIEKNELFTYQEVNFTGLTALTIEEAQNFFLVSGFLFTSKKDRKYAPPLLKSSVANLQQVLVNRGYRSAQVAPESIPTAEDANEDAAVTVTVNVIEGPLNRVVRYEQRFAEGVDASAIAVGLDPADAPNVAFTPEWEQETMRDMRNRFFRAGYPDVRIRLRVTKESASGGERPVEVVAVVQPGPRIKVAEVTFTNLQETHEPVLRRRLETHRDAWLNPLAVEETRYNLIRLGIFADVEPSTTDVPGDEQPPRRNVDFALEPGDRLEVSVLGGWGTYEIIWLALEAAKYNLWGRAHTIRARVMQSFKTTSGLLSYRIPGLFGERFDGLFSIDGLRREEVSFVREEFGFSAGVDRYFEGPHIRLDLRYRIEEVRATEIENEDIEDVGLESARIAAIDFLLSHDRRDDPLFPSRGYRLRFRSEVSSDYFGGTVSYQRLEFDASWHRPLRRNLIFHTAFRQNLIFDFGGGAEQEIPFNKRFFPGGSDSIRGYPEGEASPREDGTEIGAETATFLFLELEQRLSPNLSVVLLGDSLLVARDADEFPGGDYLQSAGLGLRYRTPFGPLRLEGAYNVQKRPDDPDWNLIFTLGYPF